MQNKFIKIMPWFFLAAAFQSLNKYDVIFPTKELIDFKQGADVIVLACNVDGLYYARIVHFENQIFQSDSLAIPCPE